MDRNILMCCDDRELLKKSNLCDVGRALAGTEAMTSGGGGGNFTRKTGSDH